MENKPKQISQAELNKRWTVKKNQIQTLSNNIQSLRLNLTKDLKSDNEKVFLTALVISLMDKTAERVGNDESANNGHYGITGLEKKHIKINGDKIYLKYVGKSGVEHEKEFTDSKLADALKRAIANSSNHNVFTTSNGFNVNAAKVNRYLKDFSVRAKDIRGYSANKWVIEKLRSKDIPKEEKDRKKVFSEVLKSVSEKIGHGKSMLRNQYLIPELEQNYIEMGKIIDVANKNSYEKGGPVTTNGRKGGWLKGKRHYSEDGKPLGGIPAVVGSTEKPVELEGGEVIINREASKKHWKELSRINQSAGGGVPIGPPDMDEDEYKDGGKVIDFNPNHIPRKDIYNYAKMVKTKYPKVWDLGGNIFGNEAFKNLERVIERGYWTDNEEWMYIKWRSYVARHKQDFRIAGVIAMLKWVDKVDKGWAYMRDLIEDEIAKRYANSEKLKKGGAVTYKQKYNKKYGYDTNETHDLSEVAKDTGVSEKGLQQIYNKGVGAYKTNPESVRPNVKSKEQWAMGRVYSAVMGGKAARIDANELRMENGGATSWEKMVSASSRFRPYETIVFDPPLIGNNGAKLVSYTWAYEMTMQPNREGELVGKRVSDWTQAEISAETGRGIVHQYTVQLPDGTFKTVSSESVPILMGYVDRTQAKVFGNLATASKTLAKQQMSLAIMEAKYKEYLDAIQSIKEKGFPEPKVEKVSGYTGYRLFVGDGSCVINDDGSYDQERLDCAKGNYINNRLIEMGIDAYKSNRSSAIYDLKNRVERQKRKVEQMLKTPNMELGGDLMENNDNLYHLGGIMGDVFSIKDPELFKQIITLYNHFSDKFGIDNYFIDHNDNSVVFLRKSNFIIKEIDEMSNEILRLKSNFDVLSDKQPLAWQNNFKFYLNSDIKYSDGGNIECNRCHEDGGNVKEDFEMISTKYLDSIRTQDKSNWNYDLEKSIENKGVLEPVIISYYPEDNLLALTDGHNRLDTAMDLGIEKIPAKLILRYDNPIGKIKVYKSPNYNPNAKKPSDLGIYEDGGNIESHEDLESRIMKQQFGI